MKEVKDYQIKARIPVAKKDEIAEYCEKHDLSISEFLRISIDRMLASEFCNQEEK